MIIHLSILFVIVFASFFYNRRTVQQKLLCIEEGRDYAEIKGQLLPWLLVFGYIAVLAGLRTSMNDTSVYVSSFQDTPGTWEAIINTLQTDGKDKGFAISMNLFKRYISDDYHAWFLLFAILESLAFIYILRRECVDFTSACYYFFASTLYYNYFSMMRQWFAVVILFAGSLLIKAKKPILYILLCVLMAQFHTSAYLMIPVYFMVKGRAWSLMQVLILLGFCIAVVFLNPLLQSLGDALEGTTYDYVVDAMQTSSGSSAIRIIIAAVPVVIAWLDRKHIHGRMIEICINMSLLNLLLNILATLTSGLYVIRLATYTALYNVILFPYLLHFSFVGKNRVLIKALFYGLYLLFYFYQMSHQGAFAYRSDILGSF